jgi:hypothetical protein
MCNGILFAPQRDGRECLNCQLWSCKVVTLKVEVICSSETLVTTNKNIQHITQMTTIRIFTAIRTSKPQILSV